MPCIEKKCTFSICVDKFCAYVESEKAGEFSSVCEVVVIFLQQLSPVHTGDKVDSRQNRRPIGYKVDSRLCRRFVESRLSPARSTLSPSSTCSTRSTLWKVYDFCRPNVVRPFDFVASVYRALESFTGEHSNTIGSHDDN